MARRFRSAERVRRPSGKVERQGGINPGELQLEDWAGGR